MNSFRLVAVTPLGALEPSIAIAASRAGHLGILNLELADDADQARRSIARMVRYTKRDTGIKLDGTRSDVARALIADLPASVRVVVFSTSDPRGLPELIPQLQAQGREVWLEVTTVEGARLGAKWDVDALVAKGNEAGGWVGEETTFILLQRLLDAVDVPVYAHGGIGLHTAAACAVAGAAGAVVDAQLALARESRLPEAVQAAVEKMDGSETVAVGDDLGEAFRLYTRPHLPVAGELARSAIEIATGDEPAEARSRAWRGVVEARVAWSGAPNEVWPLGQDAAFASELAGRFETVSGILGALKSAAEEQVELARELRPLDAGSPLAESHGTHYPIVQGPMTRVSDTAEFAYAVAEGGGLPFLALALMRGPESEKLLEETKQKLGDRPWGVGILGFVPLDLRTEQLEVIHRHPPPFVLIAGGRPDQAKKLEDKGISTYLHVPSPGLLRLFVQDGARRFVFEGRECGGHVGPRSSFVLWNSMIATLLDELKDADAADCHVLFAGGIHDARSASMVAAMASPLAARGVRVGVLLGTSYLFTEEIVTAGAIGSVFQQKALECDGTVLVESGPGHAVRCVPNPFTEEFEQTKQRLVTEGKSGDAIRQELEELNIGRLRVASKGLTRNPDYGKQKQVPKLVSVDDASRERDGMFMIGQLAAMHRETMTIAELHQDVSVAGTRRLLPDGDIQVSEVRVRASQPSQVAIVGMSCILPKAPNLATFWDNIVNKVYAIDEVPDYRWDWRDYFDEDRAAPDKIYSRWGGFIDEIPFDPLEFGMPPNSLPSIDPMHILALVATRDALKDAGYDKRPFKRQATSVILGTSGGSGELGTNYNIRSSLPWLFGDGPAGRIADEAGSKLPEWTEDSFAGLLPNVAAGRVANRFDFGGVNYVVDAACASSLTAVHLAVKELESRDSDMVIAGGVDATQTPFGFLCFSKTQALSPKGKPKTFDANADGIAIAEGIVLLVLKRLEDAERDGDRVYAVIQAVAGSSDGKAKGLTAPRPEGQVLALRRAYEKAGISAKTVGLFEAHGTGTVVGDRTEALSLSTYLDEAGADRASHAVGSVKSMIGHTKAAAGVAGLAKVALALHHKVLPPTIGVTTPNPKARFGEGPLYVNSETRPWIADDAAHPRRAGVSAFGFGGTNFHAVLEEHSGDHMPRRAVSPAWPAELVLLTAPSRDELVGKIDALEKELEAGAEPALADLAFSLAREFESGWSADNVHLGLVVSAREELSERLSAARAAIAGGKEIADPKGVFYTERPLAREGETAVLFPGQGSQYPDMLRELAIHVPGVRETFERTDRALADRFPRGLGTLIFPPPAFTPQEKSAQAKALTETNVAQPALGAADVAMFRVLERLGLGATMFAGHSYGEYVALHAGGVFDEETLAVLSEARGRSIIEAAEQELGTMAAVSGTRDEVEKAIDGLESVWIANLNAPKQTIISGTKQGIERASARLEAGGLTARPIPVACAFHSPLVAPAQERLAGVLATRTFTEPKAVVFSNTTAAPYPADAAGIAELLAKHLTSPVLFADEVEAMYAAGARIFVEAGPKNVLSGLTRSTLGDRPHVAVATDRTGQAGLASLLACLAQLAAHGVGLRATRLFEGRPVRALDLKKLAAETAPKPPTPTTWLVHAGKARPHQKQIEPHRHVSVQPEGQPEEPRAPEPRAAAARDVPRAPAPAAGAGGDPGTDQVMLGFQDMMNKFLETQSRVMSSYLQGAPLPDAVAAGETLAPGVDPESLAPSFSAEVPAAPPAPEVEDGASQTEPVEPPAAPAPSHAERPLPTREELSAQLLSIVSERTGYPPDMLDLDADVEAELGIDSIKRVEIISALQKSYLPDDERQDPEAMERLTAVKSLGGVVDWIVQALQDVRHRADETEPASPGEPVAAAPTREELTKVLLQIVSERTGYPSEMLDLDADVEAELGIDSIKRVEIIGALRKSFFADEDEQDPEAMEELTAVKTLGGVVDWIRNTIEHAAGRGTKSPAPSSAITEEAGPSVAEAAPVAETPSDVPRLVLAPTESPLTEESGLAFDPARTVLVTDDGSGVAKAVVSRIRAAGGRVALVRPGHDTRRADEGTYESDLTRPDAIEDLLARIREESGPLAGIVHLLPLRGSIGFDAAADKSGNIELAIWRERLAAEVKSLFLLARAASPDLHRSGSSPSFLLSASAMGGAFGLPNPDADDAPAAFFAGHGALAGLVKTLALEWPTVRCKAVDLDRGRHVEELAGVLVRELGTSEPSVQVGYRGTQRLVFESRAAGLQEREEDPAPLDESSLVLVTGGARGITAEVALHLAERFRPTLVLVGRSALPEGEESRDTASLETAREIKPVLIEQMRTAGEQVTVAKVEAACQRLLKARELRDNLERMRRAGARVRYEQVDVCDERSVRELIARIESEGDVIEGVIHGAGLIEDKLIEDKTPESFDRVFDTKADSAFILSRALRAETLKFFVIFSSAAAAFGNRGQTDYAAANELLNKLAIALDARWDARVVALGWGPWAKTGMVSAELQKQFAERGVQLIDVESGCRALERELRHGRKGEAAVILAGGTWGAGPEPGPAGRRGTQEADGEGLPLLADVSRTRRGDTHEVIRTMDAARDVCLVDHRLDGHPVVPMALATELMAEVVQDGWPDLHVVGLRDLQMLKGIMLEHGVMPVRVTARTSSESPHDRIGANVDVEVVGVESGLKHYRATVELADRMPAAPEYEPPANANLEPFPLTVGEAYEKWLFHGPHFQGIAEITGIGPQDVLSRLRPSAPRDCLAGGVQGPWLIDPVVLDSGLQLVVLWCRHHFDMTPLPSRFRQYVRYGAAGSSEVVCHVEATATLQGHSILTSLRFLDANRRMIGELRDLEASSSRELNRLATSSSA